MRDETPLERVDLGERVKALRTAADMTLREVSGRSGLSVSTLSKIENNQLSPTYANLLRLIRGLDVDIATLFSDAAAKTPNGRRSITRMGAGKLYVTSTYDYEMLCTDLVHKRMVPLKATVKLREGRDFGELITHEGEEVLYVLSGRIELITEHYAPVVLETGDCAYFDSTMGHICVAHGIEEAELFWVCSSPDAIELVRTRSSSTARGEEKMNE